MGARDWGAGTGRAGARGGGKAPPLFQPRKVGGVLGKAGGQGRRERGREKGRSAQEEGEKNPFLGFL